ncbi:hypothetical protein [Halobacteriovorax sp. JY17]|uniref:CC0125/CC1285 family lipoprotein n=1 Tax=Halobacteriovorax sp. JY17 TaxID=2014617 RepID=UPI000C6BF79C|nr:hypothetical protein [Halobacteriovorax sp. JY17]PIK15523.1 MAG: hypothetical protein CES88_02035 [Halobacteriovorax sp. JY17]
MKKITQLLLLLSLISCSTGYHKQSLSGGYNDTQLAETIYKVRFNGNGYTSLPRVQRFLLRRYAELTIEKGYDYFLELSADDLSDYSIGSSWDNESVDVTTRHSASGVIKLYKAGEEPSNAYNPYLILKKK